MHGTTTSDYTHFHLLQNYICKRRRLHVKESATIVCIKIYTGFRKSFWHETWNAKLKCNDKA